jgi:hypothetical protein
MSETELNLHMCEDLGLPQNLSDLTTVDELVEILGIKPWDSSVDQFSIDSAADPQYNCTFNTEDEWPI